MRCWVIFDTSTRVEYVRDVLNLLASPPGMMIRYDYRQKWVSDQALADIEHGAGNEWPVILAYTQWIHYKRGMSGGTSIDTPPQEMMFVPTRLAQMHLVTRQSGSDGYLFDFEVTGYPKSQLPAFTQLMADLQAKGLTPHRKWVTTVDTSSLTNDVLQNGSEDNWQDIVTALATPPLQFAEDTFWRLRSPYVDRRPAPGRIAKKWSAAVEEGATVRRVVTHFRIRDTERCSFELDSYQPVSTVTPVNAERLVKVSVASGDALDVGMSTVHLRQAGSEILEFTPKTAPTLVERIASVRLTSATVGFPSDSKASGADMQLTFAITKNPIRLVLATLFLIAGVVCGVFAPKVWDLDHTWGIVVGVVSVCCLLLAGLVGFQQLSAKP